MASDKDYYQSTLSPDNIRFISVNTVSGQYQIYISQQCLPTISDLYQSLMSPDNIRLYQSAMSPDNIGFISVINVSRQYQIYISH